MKKANSFLLLQIAAVALLLLSGAGVLLAQVTAGAISGTVTDTTGAAIPNASVTVTNEATGVSSTTKTNESGFYSDEALYTATYTVRISHPGFSDSVTRGLHLDPGQRRANNVTLVVGKDTTQVTVTAGAAQINTETSESGATIKASQIDNLMLNGRNFQTLAIMVPGVASVNGADNIYGQGTDLIVNGQSVEYTTDTIDGIYNMNTGSLAGINALPIMDGISEFSVLKDNYSAIYGFAGSGQVVINTKSGTNTFHGSAWDYLRNNAFDANNYFSTTTQALHQNLYGFTLGGPVIIPKIYNMDRSKKLFFFSAVQWHSLTQGSVIRAAMPTEAMRNGNFSASPTLPEGGLTLDAHSEALLASAGKTDCITNPTTVNQACFDPSATALLNAYWPLPNNPGGGFLNYVNQTSVVAPDTDYQARIDYSINANNLLTARMLYFNSSYLSPNGPEGSSELIRASYPGAAWNNFVRLTSTITPKLVNTATVAQTDNTGKNLISEGGSLPEGAHIAQAFPGADTLNRMPSIHMSSGWDGEGVYAWPQPYSDGEGILQDDVTWVRGNHVLQGGLFYMFGIKRQSVTAEPQGVFSFTGVHTGDPVADLLLGLDSTYSQASVQRHGIFHYRQGDAYIQDDWRATRRLNLNLGLRWVYFSNDTVSGDQVTTFDPAVFNPGEAPVVNVNGSLKVNRLNEPVNSKGEPANLLNGLIFAGKNGVSSGFFTPTKASFGPRVGFAYDLRGNGRSSLRGGYGIGYSRVALGQMFNAFGQNPPFVETANILNSLLSEPTRGTTAAPTTQTLSPAPLSFVPSQVQSYSLTYEQQIANNAVFSLAYAGSVGRHLMAFQGGFDENFPLRVSAPSTSNCLAPSQAPSSSYDFDPCINTGAASPDFTRPYAGYSTMNAQYDEGSSNYNSLQSGLTYNTGTSHFTLAYTYSKTLGTIGVHSESGVSQNTQPQNPRDFAAEYGPPAYDFTNDIAGTWVYAIPYFAHARKPVAFVLGNWTFAGLALHQSGYAFSPGISTGTNGLAIRPNQVRPFRRVGTLQEWFDTSSFAAPSYGFFGNASNGTIRGPAYTSFNTAVYKAFPVKERFKIEFRAEAFNVANHPNFNSVDTSLGDGSYGQLTGAGDPRILEFALKLSY